MPRRAGVFLARWRAERISSSASGRGRARGGCRLIGESLLSKRSCIRGERPATPRVSRWSWRISRIISSRFSATGLRPWSSLPFLWLLHWTDAQLSASRQRTAEARLSLGDVLEQMVCRRSTATTRPSTYRSAKLELGSEIHAWRRAPRRAHGRWFRRDSPVCQRRLSDRDAELPALRAHVRLSGRASGTAFIRLRAALTPAERSGLPVSLGCIRLGGFPAKLARWWTPTHAKFFVHFEPNRYRKFGVAATGKARGFLAPVQVKIEIAAAVTERPTSRTPPSRPKNKPFSFFPLAGIWPY